MPTTYGSINSDESQQDEITLADEEALVKRGIRAWLDDELGPPDMVTVNILLTLSTA